LAQQAGGLARVVAWMPWVGALGQLEQISPLRARQLQDAGNARPYGGRHRHFAALLDPRIPGDADAAQLGDFFAAQPRGAAPHAFGQAGHLRRDARAGRAHELAERLAAPRGTLVDGRRAGWGGSIHTRISNGLVRVWRGAYLTPRHAVPRPAPAVSLHRQDQP